MTAARLRPFGTTIFTEMSSLAARTGAVNLGQGFPDTDGPPAVVTAVESALRSGRRTSTRRSPACRISAPRSPTASAAATAWRSTRGTAVQVTFGATEAIAATMLGLLEPGDEV